MVKISICYNLLGSVLSAILFRVKCNRIRSILRSLNEHTRDRLKLNIIFTILFVIHLVCISFFMYGSLSMMVNKNQNPLGVSVKTYFWWSSSESQVYDTFLWIFMILESLSKTHWIQIFAFVYTFIAILIELNKMSCLEKYLKLSVINETTLKNLAIDVIRFRNLKTQFEDTFNVFPWLWWSYWFIGWSGTIQYTQANTSTPIHQLIAFTAQSSIQFGLTILFNFIKNHYIGKCQSVCQKMADNLMIKSVVVGKSDLIMSVRQELLIANYYTALGLFPLDNTLLLTFSSAVISFTVMCLNL